LGLAVLAIGSFAVSVYLFSKLLSGFT